MAVSDDRTHAFDRSYFFRRALCVASGNKNPRLWVSAMHAADEGARFAVGLFGHAAGVHDHNAGGGKITSGTEPLMAQIGGNGLSIRAACAAPEVLDVISFHMLSVTTGQEQSLAGPVYGVPTIHRSTYETANFACGR